MDRSSRQQVEQMDPFNKSQGFLPSSYVRFKLVMLLMPQDRKHAGFAKNSRAWRSRQTWRGHSSALSSIVCFGACRESYAETPQYDVDYIGSIIINLYLY